jgi:short-subunit dehydrogenase
MDLSFRVNFHGPLNITRAFLPRLREKNKGTLLFVSSQAAWHADPSAGSYVAAKFALSGTWVYVLVSRQWLPLTPHDMGWFI